MRLYQRVAGKPLRKEYGMAFKKVTIDEKAMTLTIVCDLQAPTLSSTGKQFNIAVAGGIPEGVQFKGKNVRVQVSAGYKNADYVKT